MNRQSLVAVVSTLLPLVILAFVLLRWRRRYPGISATREGRRVIIKSFLLVLAVAALFDAAYASMPRHIWGRLMLFVIVLGGITMVWLAFWDKKLENLRAFLILVGAGILIIALSFVSVSWLNASWAFWGTSLGALLMAIGGWGIASHLSKLLRDIDTQR